MLWGAPRSRSTAFCRTMIERGDLTGVHEPFRMSRYSAMWISAAGRWLLHRRSFLPGHRVESRIHEIGFEAQYEAYTKDIFEDVDAGPAPGAPRRHIHLGEGQVATGRTGCRERA